MFIGFGKYVLWKSIGMSKLTSGHGEWLAAQNARDKGHKVVD